MQSWLAEQSSRMMLSWEKSIERFYPQYLELWTNPTTHLRVLTEEWNTLAAATDLDWDKYLAGQALKLIDLGSGAGWLSIMLSKRENVERIYALDTSPNNLQVMMPALAELMEGNLAKINPVLGFFTPILVDDGFFDAAVASAAIHHASDLTEFLSEVYRVLKPGGVLLILNEQPISSFYYMLTVIYRCAKILRTVAFRRWQPISKLTSESGLVIDPFLGDRAYCYWQYQAAIQAVGFSFQAIETGYRQFKFKKRAWREPDTWLTHFVAQKPR